MVLAVFVPIPSAPNPGAVRTAPTPVAPVPTFPTVCAQEETMETVKVAIAMAIIFVLMPKDRGRGGRMLSEASPTAGSGMPPS